MTGMRQGEQFALQWEDVDLKAGLIRLNQTKNGQGRFVRLNSRALACLQMWHDRGIGKGRVFSNLKPRWLKDAFDTAGPKKGFQLALSAAHVCITIGDGWVDLRTVQGC